ncbi:hypothetical protein [Azohydromonas lata]|uniref:Uncharacterized protein n=1 Tax=Azohydromonas lata TaxID=45677 RepID=A0ABU5II14_9BURK|nr:hypothetical protein [Azohydromonas lata]MDZ5458789.1 hypothetical protein [Azohydromonas lata]
MPGFLIGIVVGAVAASAYLKKKGAATLGSSRGSALEPGRVDELSSAASMASPQTTQLNAGDGTPGSWGSSPTSSTGSGVPLVSGASSSATGLSENRH